MSTTTIYTVGHSTLALEDFVALLKAHGIRNLVDVRTVPTSRHNPQFNQDNLAGGLREAGLTYRHVAALGGLRHSRKDSENTAWRNTSFRGYADYMQTPEFAEAVEDLAERAHTNDLAIMCAEAVPWRCHRSLIGDALLVRSVQVLDIMSPTSAKPHTMTSFAKVQGKRITYPEQ
ncbi:DUF488 domain-containing protein [Arthrobacter ginkgonis]|uniref:DUF488 domain-containing protein n=1 Tax=Arthrobacter ginkgonis TaxID=1630594 RepID=A0ABP7BQF1_9MICC